jgi:hypothetical protein
LERANGQLEIWSQDKDLETILERVSENNETFPILVRLHSGMTTSEYADQHKVGEYQQDEEEFNDYLCMMNEYLAFLKETDGLKRVLDRERVEQLAGIVQQALFCWASKTRITGLQACLYLMLDDEWFDLIGNELIDPIVRSMEDNDLDVRCKGQEVALKFMKLRQVRKEADRYMHLVMPRTCYNIFLKDIHVHTIPCIDIDACHRRKNCIMPAMHYGRNSWVRKPQLSSPSTPSKIWITLCLSVTRRRKSCG